MQTDVGEKRVGGSEFTLSPIGILLGFGMRHYGNEMGAVGLRADVRFFPLLSATTITALNGDHPFFDLSSLVLGSASLEWAPHAVRGNVAWPWFLSAGATHAFASPRAGTRGAFIGGLGFLHAFKDHADLRASIELLAPSIGKTFLQIPIAVSMHR